MSKDAPEDAITVHTFSLPGQTLFAALNLIKPAIQRRNTIPILTMFRLTGHGDRLALEATNLDVSYRYEITGHFPRFDICADFLGLHRFLSVQKTLKGLDAGLIIEVPEGGDPRLALKGFRFATPEGATFRTLPAADFPDPPTGEYEAVLDFDPSPIRQVKTAISTEETRYYLNGVYLHAPVVKAEDGTETRQPLTLAATDGHRLKLARTEMPYSGPGIIIPRPLALWLATQAPGKLTTGPARLKWEAHPLNEADTLTVFAKTIDGTFPDYTRVLPKDPKFIAVIDRQELLDALNTLNGFITENSATKFRFAGQTATLSKRSIEAQTLSLLLTGVRHDGEEPTLDIGLNPKYLLDHLATVTGDTVQLDIIDAASPVRTDEGNLTSVLMPLRI